MIEYQESSMELHSMAYVENSQLLRYFEMIDDFDSAKKASSPRLLEMGNPTIERMELLTQVLTFERLGEELYF